MIRTQHIDIYITFGKVDSAVEKKTYLPSSYTTLVDLYECVCFAFTYIYAMLYYCKCRQNSLTYKEKSYSILLACIHTLQHFKCNLAIVFIHFAVTNTDDICMQRDL